MYFIANLQPRLPDSLNKYGFLTQDEKKIIIDKFSKNKLKGITLDICDDHGGGEKPGFILDQDKKFGKVNDIIITNNGDLMITGEMFNNNKKTDLMIKEMSQIYGKDYGVSIWLDLLLDKDSSSSSSNSWKNKNLNHVAITKEPGLGEYGAYIYEWSFKKQKIDDLLKDKYYDYKNNIKDNNNNSLKYASNDLIDIWNQGKNI